MLALYSGFVLTTVLHSLGLGGRLIPCVLKARFKKKKFIIAFAFPCCDCHTVVLC